MLVVKKKKNKNISLILELNPTFIKHISRKNYSVMTTNMAALFKWLGNWVDVPYVPTDVFVNKFIGW